MGSIPQRRRAVTLRRCKGRRRRAWTPLAAMAPDRPVCGIPGPWHAVAVSSRRAGSGASRSRCERPWPSTVAGHPRCRAVGQPALVRAAAGASPKHKSPFVAVARPRFGPTRPLPASLRREGTGGSGGGVRVPPGTALLSLRRARWLTVRHRRSRYRRTPRVATRRVALAGGHAVPASALWPGFPVPHMADGACRPSPWLSWPPLWRPRAPAPLLARIVVRDKGGRTRL